MDYRDRITANPKIMLGKPIIKGTRITVELIVGDLAGGMTIEEILEAYPHLTREDIEAAERYKKFVVNIAKIGADHFREYSSKWNKDQILNYWWEGLKFFLGCAFYQGRRDEISKEVERRTIDVLQGLRNEEIDLLNQVNDEVIKEKLKSQIGKGKIGKGADIELTLSFFELIRKLPENNIVKYSKDEIENGNFKKHYKELHLKTVGNQKNPYKIFSVGPKIASLYLRDLVMLYGLEVKIPEDEKIYLQPIDTWVRQILHLIKIEDTNDRTSDNEVRSKIENFCSSMHINQIEFNHGIWYIGSNSIDIILKYLDKIEL